MTGRDLIVYILENNLENEELFKNGEINYSMLGLVDSAHAAVHMHCGLATVSVLTQMKKLQSVRTYDAMYFPEGQFK